MVEGIGKVGEAARPDRLIVSLTIAVRANAATWAWSLDHGELCRVVDSDELWGDVQFRIWLPARDATVPLRSDRLVLLSDSPTAQPAWLSYAAAAARVEDALTGDTLLAPIGGSLIPLPHQIHALARATSGDRARCLLADEVGLGKTIEAGLVMRELKLRGEVERILVVAPKGLVTQWIAEMRTHFGEEFRFLSPADFEALRRVQPGANPWRAFDEVICSMDSVKPLERRQGWSSERVAEYNRDRFDGLTGAGWDLIVVDEAHRLGGSTQQVARHKLGQGLADASRHLLLLSATPHQGKTDAFHRLMSLLDRNAFADPRLVTRERVHAFAIRTEKRQTIDAAGKPLFKPRNTRLLLVGWTRRHSLQSALYDAVTEYARDGYNQAMREKKGHVGFLMVLLQRLVTSSTQAIQATLERRLEALELPDEQLGLFPELSELDWAEMDAQDRVDTVLGGRLRALTNERAEVELLLEAARHASRAGPDAKAEALLDLIYSLQREEGDPALKVLVFTEFVATQDMLCAFLTGRGFSVASINGSMTLEERADAQRAFADDARILVSTDAGGEGLNLQFCHVVVNYDIPWNPMKLEQRIGRVDRIGQTRPVRAVNLVVEGTVEHRVREVLEEKLAVILREFGVDKTGDILDSAEAGRIFDGLYVEAITDPAGVEAKVETALQEVRALGTASRTSGSVLGHTDSLDPAAARRLMGHPLPTWIESMMSSYLEAVGCSAGDRDISGSDRHPPSNPTGAGAMAHGLDDPWVRSLATRVVRFVPGQPVPVAVVPGLPVSVRGLWSLWRISLRTDDRVRRRIMPLFLHDDGRVLGPTARFIWDRVITGPLVVRGRPRRRRGDGGPGASGGRGAGTWPGDLPGTAPRA